VLLDRVPRIGRLPRRNDHVGERWQRQRAARLGDLRGDLQLISVHDLVHELPPAIASDAQTITCGA
jgi:hypothetical protein